MKRSAMMQPATRLDGSPTGQEDRPFREGYRASSRSDVAELVAAMRGLGDNDKILCLGAVHIAGLMLATGILRFLFWIYRLRRQHEGRVITELYQRDRQAVLRLWEQTCAHVADGRDAEDTDSVGGWSQREIDIFIEMMRRVGLADVRSDCAAASAASIVEGGQG